MYREKYGNPFTIGIMRLLQVSGLLLLCLQLWLWVPCNATGSATVARRYSINLDLPAEERWREVAEDNAAEISMLLDEVASVIPPAVLELVHKLGINVDKLLPHPYGLELQGLAQAANLDLTNLVLGNLVYELTAYGRGAGVMGCTSIVAQAENGTMYHARNLDYRMTDILRNLTIVVDFKDNGKTVYTGTTFAGFIGLATGQKPNAFTISFDERNQGKWWMNALEALIAGTHGVTVFLIRDTLGNPEMDFKMAVQVLSTCPVIAPGYLIVGGVGPGEGAVITRGRSSADDVWWLGSNGSWFLVETNYDHWKPPPASDDRRDPAVKGMKKMGQNDLSPEGVFNVLSTPPVLNGGTAYTAMMSAAIPDLYQSWVRHPDTL